MEKNRSPFILLVALMSASVLLIAFLSVWQRNDMIQIGYETEGLQEEKTALLRQKKDLLAAFSRLSSIERIERLALEEIQMKSPDPGQRIYLSLTKLEQALNQ